MKGRIAYMAPVLQYQENETFVRLKKSIPYRGALQSNDILPPTLHLLRFVLGGNIRRGGGEGGGGGKKRPQKVAAGLCNGLMMKEPEPFDAWVQFKNLNCAPRYKRYQQLPVIMFGFELY